MDIYHHWDSILRSQSPIEKKHISFDKFSFIQRLWLKLKITCRLILSRLHGKQNLWWFTDGHWTKWVSSSRSWHNVHFNVGFGAGGAPAVVLLPINRHWVKYLPQTDRFHYQNGCLPVVGTSPSAGGGGGTLALKFDALLTGIGMPGNGPCAFVCCASDDVTVVLETCREPDDRRPLEAAIKW